MSTDILKSGDELDRLSQSMQVDLQEERKLLELPNAYRSPAITRSTGISTDDYNKVPLQDLDVSTYGMEEIDDKRAEEQSISDQWANAAVKMVGLAGTTFLDSTVGTVAGLTNALISDKPFLESFIDDPVSRKLKEFNDSMEQWMPNYYTRERQDQTFAVGTANFWADKILKNMGFTIGAVMAGMVTGGATASVLGRKTLQNQIARNLSKNSVKLASKNITPKAIKEMAEKGVIDEKLIAEELLANAKQLKNVDAATEIIASVAGSIGESRIEAINAKDELFEKYKQEGLSDEQAMEKATKAANLIFGGNMAVLSAGNYAQFRKAFSPGYNPSKLGDAYLTKTVKDGKLSYAGQKNIEKFIKRSQALFGNPAIEGNEEMMQNAIKNASEEFVSRGENLEGKETVKAYIDSFLKGMIKTYSDPHAYEEGFAGIFAGGIGSPTITGSGVGWAGGALGDLKEVNRNIAQAEEATEALNKITESERFQEGYRNAVANAKYESQKEAALKVGDQFEFKNIEHEQLINDALTFLEYGQFSDFIESIESVKNTEASELRKLVQIQPKQDPNNKDQKAAEPIDPYKNITDDEELKTYLVDKADRIKEEVNYLKDIYYALEKKFPDITKESKELIAASASKAHNSAKRIEAIFDNVIPELKDLLPNTVEKATNEDWAKFKESIDELKVKDEFKKDPNFEEKDKALRDISYLRVQKKAFLENYLELFNDPEQAEETVEAAKAKQEAEEKQARVEAVKEGTILKDGEGKLYKVRFVGDKKRIYTFNEETKKFDVEVEELTPETLAKYSEQIPETGEASGDPFKSKYEAEIDNADSVERLLEVVYGDLNNKFSDMEGNEADAIINVGFKAPKAYLDRARRKYQSLTGMDPGKGFGVNKVVREFYRNKDGNRVLAVKDYKNKKITIFNELKSYKKNLKPIAEFTDSESFIKWRTDGKWMSEKLLEEESRKELRISNIEKLFEAREKALTKVLKQAEETQKRVRELEVQIGEKSENINRLFGAAKKNTINMVKRLDAELQDLYLELATLNDMRDQLYFEMEHFEKRWMEENEGNKKDLTEELKQFNDEIKKTENVIEKLKSYAKALVNIISRFTKILSAVFSYSHNKDLTKVKTLKNQLSKIEAKIFGSENVDEKGSYSLIDKEAVQEYQNIVQELLKGELDEANAARRIDALKVTVEKSLKESEDKLAELKATHKLLLEEKDELDYQLERLRVEVKPETYTPVTKKPVVHNPEDKPFDDGDAPVDPDSKEWEKETNRSVKRYLKHVFLAFAGNSMNMDKDPSQRRYFNFVNNHTGEGLKAMIVPMGLISSKEETEKLESVYKANLYHVVITDVNGYFLGEDGKRIKNSEGKFVNTISEDIIDQLVYTTLPHNNLSVGGVDKFFTPETARQWNILYPGKSVEEAEQLFEQEKREVFKAHTQFLSYVGQEVENGRFPIVTITGKTRGIENIDKAINPDNRLISEALQTESADDVEVILHSYDSIKKLQDSKSPEAGKYAPGFTYVKDKKTGNLYKVQPRNLNDSEVKLVHQLFEYFAKRLKPGKDGKVITKDAGVFEFKVKDKGRERTIKTNIFEVLTSFAFWTGDNLNAAAAKELKSAIETAKETGEDIEAIYERIYSNPNNLVDKSETRAFYWRPYSEVVGGQIVLGNKVVNLLGKDGNLNPALEEALNEFFEDKRFNVKRTLLRTTRNNQSGSDKFYLPVELDSESGEALMEEYKSYEDYLINNVLETSTVTKGATDGEGRPVLTHHNQNFQYAYGEVSVRSETPSQKPSTNTSKSTEDTGTINADTNFSKIPDGKYPVQLTEGGKTISGFLVRKGGNTYVEGLPVKTTETINALVDPYNEEAALNLSDLQEFGINLRFINSTPTNTENENKSNRLNFDSSKLKGLKIKPLVLNSLEDLVKGTYKLNLKFNDNLEESILFTVVEDGIEFPDNLTERQNAALVKIFGTDYTENGKHVLSIRKLNAKMQGFSFSIHTAKSKPNESQTYTEEDFPRDTGGSLGLDEGEGNKVSKNEDPVGLPDAEEPPFRTVRETFEGTEDFKKAKKWFEQRFPGVKFEKIYDIMQSGVYGRFKDAAVQILEGAEVGTTYHEAWHVLTQLFLTAEERITLYSEARQRLAGKTVTIGIDGDLIEVQGDQMTDRQAEEYLAEEFRDYMLGKKIELFKGNETKSIFRQIKDLLKNFIEKVSFGLITFESDPQQYNEIIKTESEIYKLFKALETNRLPAQKFDSTSQEFHRPIKGMSKELSTDEFKADLMNSLDYLFFSFLLKDGNSLFDVFRNKKINTRKIYKDIKDLLETSIEKGYLPEKALNARREILKNFETEEGVIQNHINHLSRYGIELVDEDYINENIDEVDRGKDSGGIVPVSALKLSGKQNATNIVKLFLSTLMQVNQKGSQVRSPFTLLPQPTDFGQMYSMLASRLSGSRTIEEMISRMEVMKEYDPSLNKLIERLKSDVPASMLSSDDFLLRVQFEQTFRKDKTNYGFGILNKDGSVTFIPSNGEGILKTIRQEFEAKSKEVTAGKLIEDEREKNKFYYDSSKFKPYQKFKNEFYDKLYEKYKKEYKYSSEAEARANEEARYMAAKAFLSQLGIDINFSSKLIPDRVKDKVWSAIFHISDGIEKGNQVYLFQDEFYHDNYNNLNQLILAKSLESLDTFENSHFNLDGDRVYDNTLYSYISFMTELINSDMPSEEILEMFPHLEHSEIFKTRGNYGNNVNGFEIVVIEGIRNDETREAVPFKDMTEADKIAFSFSVYRNNKNKGSNVGYFKMLRPADNSIERYIHMDLGSLNNLSPYLTELTRLKNPITKNYKNYQSNYNKGNFGLVLDILVTKEDGTKDMDMVKELKAFINDDRTPEEFLEQFGDIISYKDGKHLDKLEDEFIDKLLETGLVVQNSDGLYNIVGLGKSNAENLKYSEVKNVIGEYVSLSSLAAIEQMNLFFGDPIAYKSVEDMFKRFSGAVGTKRVSVTSESANEFIDRNLKDVKGRVPLRHNGKPVIRTFTFEDVIVINNEFLSSVQETLGLNGTIDPDEKQRILKSLAPYGSITKKVDGKTVYYTVKEYMEMKPKDKYGIEISGMEEGDGSSYASLDEWRMIKVRSGDWSFGEKSLEALYQWEKYELNNVSESKRYYVDPVTGEKSENPINVRELPVANALKPQYYGVNTEGIHTMFKTSLLPLLPSMIKETNLEKLHNFMIENQIGIASHYSANKGVSTKLTETGSLNTIYDRKGNFKINDNFVTQEIYYDYFGIQLETGNKVKKKVVTGTQMMKQVISNLFESGKALNERFQRYVDDYFEFNNKRVEIGKELLKQKFGLHQDTNGNYSVKNINELVESLRQEAIKRDAPDNVFQAINYLKHKTNLDFFPNRTTIEYIVTSLADSIVLNKKRNGGAYYQEPATMFEVGVTRENQEFDGKVFKSSDLKFYSKGKDVNGNEIVTSMEVYLPDIYRGKVDPSKPSELLKIIGFRIPTQGLNSIESIKVKGFLPASAGELVIMPSDIVAKAGSDYDIDKLNLYLPNYYENAAGNLVYIKPSLNRNEVVEEYGWYLKGFEGSFVRKLMRNVKEIIPENLKYEKEIIPIIKYILSNQPTSWNNLILELLKEGKGKEEEFENEVYAIAAAIKSQYDKGEFVNDDLSFEPKSFEEFWLMSIENGIANVQDQIITDPDNFKQLITPNSAHILKEISEEINKLRGIDRAKASLSDILSPAFMSDIEKRYLGANKAIGIAALASTFHVMSQVSGLKIKGFSINLPHHNEDGKIILGKQKDVNGEYYISDILSQWINAAVDAAKDPFMFDLNATSDTLPVVLALTAAGVPIKTVSLFMNQPIIHEYLRRKAIYRSEFFKSSGKEMSRKKTVQEMLGVGRDFEKKTFSSTIPNEASLTKGIKSDEFDNFQRQMLLDYYKYEQLAEEFRKTIQATTYDTHGIGKTLPEGKNMISSTDQVIEAGVFENFDVLMNEGFFAPYREGSQFVVKQLENFFITSSSEVIKDDLDQISKFYSTINTSKDKKAKVVNKFRSDFLTYLLTVTPLKFSKYSFNPAYQDTYLLTKVGEYIQNEKRKIEKGENVPGKALFERITVVDNTFNGKRMLNIRAREKSLSTLETNAVTDSWRELYMHNPEMAIDIFRRLILQGGFQGSSTNFMEWVPVPIVYNTMNYALAEFNSLSFAEKRAFVHKFKTEFFIANYEDNDIVPNAKKKYIASNFPFKKKARLLNESMSSKEIETRKKDGKKVWAARPTLIGESNLPEDLTVIKDHKNNHIHMGYGEIYPHVHNKISLEHPIFETKYKPLPKKTIFDKLYIDSNQIEKIKSGKQTVLTLKEMLEPGTYELPDGTVIYVVRTSYTESIKEFRSADNWAKAMGYSNLQDLKSNNEYEYINDFVEDKPDSGVFTSFIELSGDKVEIERPQVKTYTGKIKSLKDNQVFVFGSNPVGINGNPKTGTGGAALVATQNNWVEQSEKMDNRLSNSGKAYGLVTVTYPGRKNSLTLNEISQNVKQLYEFARNNPDKEFLVAYTAGGRNLNGYTDAEMAEAFSGTKIPSNVVFEDKFAEMLTGDVQAVKDTAPTTNLKQTIKLRKIISGGQYGIDLMGIEVGKELGFETGGVATRGYRVEGGFNPGLKDYGLTESNYANYLVRTEQNVIDSDGTILFGNMSSSGSKSTIGFLNKHGKPYIVNPNAQEIANFVRNKKVVNIAGNRKSKLSEKQLEDFRTTLREGLGIVKSERDSAINSNVGNAHENC